MLSARWRRRAFCLQRNTTSRENPKDSRARGREGRPGASKFLSGRRASAAVWFLQKDERSAMGGKRVREVAALAVRAAREIISSANRETFIQYPRQHLASNGSTRVSLWGFGKCSLARSEGEGEVTVMGGLRTDGKLHTPLVSN